MYLYICGSVGGRWVLMCAAGGASLGSDVRHGAALNPTKKSFA